jgi:hypothetical protein
MALPVFTGTNAADNIGPGGISPGVIADPPGTVPGPAADTIYGGGGPDVLTGGGDNDIISGGADNDVVTGNMGNDTLFGDAGDDTISGNMGDDTIFGGDGKDTIPNPWSPPGLTRSPISFQEKISLKSATRSPRVLSILVMPRTPLFR